MLAGFCWANLVNYQKSLSWYRKPWMHVAGMAIGAATFSLAAEYEDKQLKSLITSYERKGYVIPEERKKLFEPQQYT